MKSMAHSTVISRSQIFVLLLAEQALAKLAYEATTIAAALSREIIQFITNLKSS